MLRLLHQNWYVLYRSWLLRTLCAAIFLLSFFVRANSDAGMYAVTGFGAVYAFLAAVYLGGAGSSGRLSGQVMGGSPRPLVFLAAWLTVMAAALLILLSAVVGNGLGGLLNSDDPLRDGDWAAFLLGMTLNAAALNALYVLIGLLLTGRRGRGTLILVICLSVFLALAWWDTAIESALSEAPYDSVYAGDGWGGPVIRLEPNPDYVPEPERSRLAALARFLPATQGVYLLDILYGTLADGASGGVAQAQPVSAPAVPLAQIYLGSTLLAAGSIAAGILLFQRRELD